jgi:hypothetical protein
MLPSSTSHAQRPNLAVEFVVACALALFDQQEKVMGQEVALSGEDLSENLSVEAQVTASDWAS